jgi:hypothetical protein
MVLGERRSSEIYSKNKNGQDFRNLALKMLAVNDRIELQSPEIEKLKMDYAEFMHLQISGEFERVHEYRYYFPANNISNVLSRI